MKLNNQDFDLMLNAAWNSFENTLFLWGMTKADIEVFEELMATTINLAKYEFLFVVIVKFPAVPSILNTFSFGICST